ncbi:hypothetical protein NEOC65_001203 [Neochlamydia sp. AcF65]|nr:hypothetical protein [Neochlamydia sp. AcF65]MBS4170200.1 hypothetical protein [Neochlamydia sp. AcF95]
MLDLLANVIPAVRTKQPIFSKKPFIFHERLKELLFSFRVDKFSYKY